MNTSHFRAICRVLFALAMLSLAQPSFAQQNAAPICAAGPCVVTAASRCGTGARGR